jgi:hypothetical protein
MTTENEMANYIEMNQQAVQLSVLAYKAALEQGADEGTAQGILGTAQRFWLQALMQKAQIEFYQMDAMTKGKPQQ